MIKTTNLKLKTINGGATAEQYAFCSSVAAALIQNNGIVGLLNSSNSLDGLNGLQKVQTVTQDTLSLRSQCGSDEGYLPFFILTGNANLYQDPGPPPVAPPPPA